MASIVDNNHYPNQVNEHHCDCLDDYAAEQVLRVWRRHSQWPLFGQFLVHFRSQLFIDEEGGASAAEELDYQVGDGGGVGGSFEAQVADLRGG